MNGHSNGIHGPEKPEKPVYLPSARPFDVSSNVVIQPPLTRRGHGPGLLLLIPTGIDLEGSDKTLDPPPLQKWAEEGYAVAQIILEEAQSSTFERHMQDAIATLSELKECDSTESLGVISYNAPITRDIASIIESASNIAAIITYGNIDLDIAKPQLRHTSAASTKATARNNNLKLKSFDYQGAGSFFVIPSHDDFRSAPAAVAHTRCLTFLKPLTNGPYFDLEAIWEEHTKFEFAERAVEKTMATMVQEPYVNHIPTMTGGIGRDRLTNFYRYNFIFGNPQDTAMELVSRTVGVDRVIDEFIFSFTHDKTIDWLAPGVPPTGKYVELPFTSVVNIRGDRLYHEHIGWDQATFLRQTGLMPEYLPFPYELSDGRKPASGKRFEYRVPTAGRDISKKLVDERSVESNGMFEHSVREVDI